MLEKLCELTRTYVRTSGQVRYLDNVEHNNSMWRNFSMTLLMYCTKKSCS